MQQEIGEQGAREPSVERDRTSVVDDLERAENPKLHVTFVALSRRGEQAAVRPGLGGLATVRRAMTKRRQPERFLDEVRRYLIAVDVFRAEGHEPHWQPEHSAAVVRKPRGGPLAISLPPIP